MTITLSAALTNEMNSLSRRPAAGMTVERFFPEWTEQVAGSDTVHYAHGHSACVAKDGNGAGEDILFRVRVTVDGNLQIATLKGASLETPSLWDALWTSAGVSGLVYPNWSANSGVSYGGSVSCAYSSTHLSFRVFVFNSVGEVKAYDFDLEGTLTANSTVAALAVDTAMQLAACAYDEIVVLRHELVEAAHAAWHKPVYGSSINRYAWTGAAWVLLSPPFLFHTHANANLAIDAPAYDSGSAAQENQWGFRACGGLGAIKLNSELVVVITALRYFYRRAYTTHTQSVAGWLFHRDNGVWERAFDNDESDYDLDQQLWLDAFSRGMTVDGRHIVTWTRLVEPADHEQEAGNEHIPRVMEAVCARISDDGRHLTQFQYLGDPRHLAGTEIVAVNHNGTKALYALGWQIVLKSDPAYWLCDVPESYKFNLELTTSNYTVRRDNRWGMAVTSQLQKIADRFVQPLLREGNLIRAYHGAVVLIPTQESVNHQLSIESDDGYGSNSGYWYIDSTVNSVGGGNVIHTRFALPFSRGTKIISATLDLWANNGSSIAKVVHAEKASNPLAPASWIDYQGRTKTTASVSWPNPGSHVFAQMYSSPSLATVIQEVVDSYDVDTIQLFISSPDGSVSRFNGSSSSIYGTSPRLIVEYESYENATETVELAQIGQGYIDATSPSIGLEQRQHVGPLNARAEIKLLSTRAEVVEEILPLDTLTIEPVHPGGKGTVVLDDEGNEITQHHPAGISLHRGFWALRKVRWPTLFFTGLYDDLVDKLVYRMESFPWAVTGGGLVDLPVGTQGGPGDVADTRKAYKRGTMFNDIIWTTTPSPRIDGAIQTCVRFGDDRNYGDATFEAKDGNVVYTGIHRVNGLIRNIEWFNPDDLTPPGDIWDEPEKWNDVAQEAVMAGLICRSVHDPLDANGTGKKYIFAWEANSKFLESSHLDDTAMRVYGNGIFDKPDYSGVSTGRFDSSGIPEGRFYVLISDFDEDDDNWQAKEQWVHKAVAEGSATGLAAGLPAEMKMQVYGGTIYCFYRPYPTTGQPKRLWRHTITHKAGHFGAGRFGVVARGHSGIQWDVLYPGRNHIDQWDNVVDFWNIEATDCEKDWTLEEVLKHFAWQGLTETEFRSAVNDVDGGTVTTGTQYNGYAHAAENPCLDFTVTIAANGGEAGLFVRAIDNDDPLAACVRLGIVVNSTYKQADNTLNCYLVKRRYIDGVEVDVDYSPSVLHLGPGMPYKVRVSVRNDLYSVWVEGAHMGHFHDDTELGQYFGLYATGQDATFTNVRLPELHEVPENAILDPNQAMVEAMKRVIGQRHIKGVWRPYGKLLISKFEQHDAGPTFQDSLVQSSLRLSDRFYSIVDVQGAYTRAAYASPLLLPRGRIYTRVDNPNIMTTEACYREAKLICRETAERMREATFAGLPDLRVEPEDAVQVVVTQQAINGTQLVDDVTVAFDLESRQSVEQYSTRQQVIL